MFTTEDKLAMRDMLKELGVSDPIKLEHLETIKTLMEQNAANALKLDLLTDFVSTLNASLRIDLGKMQENQSAMQADIAQIKDEVVK